MFAQFSDILLYATTAQPPSFASYKVIKRIPLLGLRVRVRGRGRGGKESRREGEREEKTVGRRESVKEHASGRSINLLYPWQPRWRTWMTQR